MKSSDISKKIINFPPFSRKHPCCSGNALSSVWSSKTLKFIFIISFTNWTQNVLKREESDFRVSCDSLAKGRVNPCLKTNKPSSSFCSELSLKTCWFVAVSVFYNKSSFWGIKVIDKMETETLNVVSASWLCALFDFNELKNIVFTWLYIPLKLFENHVSSNYQFLIFQMITSVIQSFAFCFMGNKILAGL